MRQPQATSIQLEGVAAQAGQTISGIAVDLIFLLVCSAENTLEALYTGLSNNIGLNC